MLCQASGCLLAAEIVSRGKTREGKALTVCLCYSHWDERAHESLVHGSKLEYVQFEEIAPQQESLPTEERQ